MVSAKKAQRRTAVNALGNNYKNCDFEKVIPLLNNLHGYGL